MGNIGGVPKALILPRISILSRIRILRELLMLMFGRVVWRNVVRESVRLKIFEKFRLDGGGRLCVSDSGVFSDEAFPVVECFFSLSIGGRYLSEHELAHFFMVAQSLVRHGSVAMFTTQK